MDQSKHSLGLVGRFKGRFLVENDSLKMGFGNPGEKAPEDLSNARLYLKV
jgi:allophanate hydrolase subunit 2